ncbi:kelch-like protein 9 [Physella acuta]|uniref:kelch-like protein 9 n=1 Tax=Physella acuta TaxID=109671 RepID=UPI0027DD9A35|nr:kelch-like protein 9 [Physella acuta]
MREVTENCVVLHDVSCDVFTLILRTLYTGVDILTSQNLLDVWRAVHMLQIAFMVKLCEDFAIETVAMDTWEQIYTNAKLLDSENVLEHLQKFMIKNFEQISLTSTFLQLSFEELRNLIKCQDLVVSKEDLVLEAVIRWVNFVQIMTAELKESKCTLNAKDSNNVNYMMLDSSVTVDFVKNEIALRKEKLTGLLKKIRIYLVSPSLLSHVYKMDLISENKDSSDIIVDALLYHVQDLRQSHWPSVALHRTCSEYRHGGVFAEGKGHFKFLSAIEEKIYTISDSFWLREDVHLTTVNGELYAANGSLCLVLCLHDSRSIQFEHIAKLWTGKKVLHGAFTYKKKLIIVETRSLINPAEEEKLEVPNHFNLIKYWRIFCTCSNVAPLIISTSFP